MVGKTISHKIVEKLGEGGMGEVYLAEDTELDRKKFKFILQAEKVAFFSLILPLPPNCMRNAQSSRKTHFLRYDFDKFEHLEAAEYS